ncbi:enoyl-[acyl-carrier-protein] reductase FabI [Noviherbaspirillum cavernae]|uniref:Enoyl-[acyl-carrier-protein] reductase [NADH] n=1 Tax=Noviherbaspirillum cavernae TaxID=2320862 RepID=A0A418X1U8_9BURK|nr:enoyl-ACP reductase FabI [Noviherbaspirillum cavernae]RJG06429.1 enoyl-[acyl-carrier-protein] reductase FabI [Noviherbaspirillum cavernae]
MDHPLLQSDALKGKCGLIVGIANDSSIAWGVARACKALGAELALTYLNDKARPHVQPLAEQLDARLFLPLDVRDDAQMHAVFDAIRAQWGRLDFLLHSIAFAPKDDLQCHVLDTSAQGFSTAMDISCHSFIRMARLAEPLMKDGGAMAAMSYYGAQKVVPNYNIMGPVKAALEASVRYLAYELGPKKIRVHAVSPGPLSTRAASGIKDFDQLLSDAATRAPAHELVDIDDVGVATAFLMSDFARLITGGTIYIDGGYNIVA